MGLGDFFSLVVIVGALLVCVRCEMFPLYSFSYCNRYVFWILLFCLWCCFRLFDVYTLCLYQRTLIVLLLTFVVYYYCSVISLFCFLLVIYWWSAGSVRRKVASTVVVALGK